MSGKEADQSGQNGIRNNFALIQIPKNAPDGLVWWGEQYFSFEVTTSPASQKVQRRDLNQFLRFMMEQEKTDDRQAWTPRLSKDFQSSLQKTLSGEGERIWSDKTIIRVMAHLKTFAKWVHKLRPFPLGDPMAKIKLPAVGIGLDVERALTVAERRKLLDAADILIVTGGMSKDRKRFKRGERPCRKGFRPYRNRAVIYTLLETGMRRAAITRLNLSDVDHKRRLLTVVEKGGFAHSYHISRDGLKAIADYVANEREQDFARWNSPALFLPTCAVANSTGRLAPLAINQIWNSLCDLANISGRTPHSARHAMGKYIIEKTGNIAAVQKQLGHRQAAYSMQYARITAEELGKVLDER